jgi:sec-independent protein translocase protein TatC
MPTLVFFLARVGVVSAGFMVRNTKYAVLLIFIFAAVLTPTGDPATLTLMAAPMMLLYGLSIGIAWVVAPRRKNDDD